MTIDRIVRAFAGSLLLLSLALAHWVHPAVLWLTAFVGVNLLQSGLTGWCPLCRILGRLGIPSEGPCRI